MPSVERAEQFGLVQLEACMQQAGGNDSARTGVEYVTLDGETGLVVPPKDPRALAEGLRTLLSDSALRAPHGKRWPTAGRRGFFREARCFARPSTSTNVCLPPTRQSWRYIIRNV